MPVHISAVLKIRYRRSFFGFNGMQNGFTESGRVLRVHTQISISELDIKRVRIGSRIAWVVDEKGLDKSA